MYTNGETVNEVKTMDAIQSINQKIPELTLRDLFAMNVMSGICVAASDDSVNNWNFDGLAALSYKAADAMLVARRF